MAELLRAQMVQRHGSGTRAAALHMQRIYRGHCVRRGSGQKACGKGTDLVAAGADGHVVAWEGGLVVDRNPVVTHVV